MFGDRLTYPMNQYRPFHFHDLWSMLFEFILHCCGNVPLASQIIGPKHETGMLLRNLVCATIVNDGFPLTSDLS